MRKIAPLAVLAGISLIAFQAMADDAPAKSKDAGETTPEKDKPSGPQPKLVIESTEHEFGEVEAGTPLEYSFEIKNEGEAELQILKVKPSCGCTTSEFDTTIAAGATGHITLAVKKTTNYKGDVAKSARVDTNDPERPILSLILRAKFPKPEPKNRPDPAEKAKPATKDEPGSGR